MCGIVAYVGHRQAAEFLIDGLRRLEYRGYDSAGLATVSSDRRLHVVKAVGKVDMLAEKLKRHWTPGSIGVGRVARAGELRVEADARHQLLHVSAVLAHVEVRAADAAMQHLHHHLPAARFGLGQIGDTQFGVLADDGFHIHFSDSGTRRRSGFMRALSG